MNEEANNTVEGFPFWIVLRHAGSYNYMQHVNKVSMYHKTEESARKEAVRLAIEHSERFYVLKAVAYVEPQQSPLVWDDGSIADEDNS